MSVFVLFLVAAFLGLGTIAILALAKRPRASRSETVSHPLSALDAGEFVAIVASILRAMGLDVDDDDASGMTRDLRATNPAPVTGGTLLVRCIAGEGGSAIDATTISDFASLVRVANAHKGLLFAATTPSREARFNAEDTPIEIFGPDRVVELAILHGVSIPEPATSGAGDHKLSNKSFASVE